MLTKENALPRRLVLLDFARLGLWFGLMFGFLEALLLLSLYDFTHILLWRNGVDSRVLWTGPLINGGLFALAGCVLAGLWALIPSSARRWAWPVSFALFSGGVTLGLLMSPLVLQAWGCVVLALGVVVQAFRWARHHFAVEFFRRTLVPLLVLVAVAGTAGELWPKWQEQKFLASLPPATPHRPSVLLIILDTLRADHLSCYGYPRHTTPNIDRLAAEGVLFEQAYSPSTSTPPSHLAMLSGKTLRGNWFYWTERHRFRPLIAEAMADRGYATAACVGNFLWCIPQIGLRPGFARYDVYFHSPADAFFRTFYGHVLSVTVRWWGGYFDLPGRKRAGTVNQELLRWVDQTRSTGRPFFAMLNYFDVHDPYFARFPFRTAFSPHVTRKNILALYRYRRLRPNLSSADVQLLIDSYDGSLTYLDYEIGELRKALQARGLLDNTVIIVTADHGEALGEFGQFGHVEPILRQEVTHVPLIIRYPPKVPAGLRVPNPVTLRNLPATILQLTDEDSRVWFPGHSLLAGGSDPAEPVLVETQPGDALVYEQWHYIQQEGKVQLYNIINDPKEMTNVAGSRRYATIQAELHARLADLLKTEPPVHQHKYPGASY